MSINFRAALRYPFSGANRMNAWISPALFILLLQILTFTAVLVMQQAYPDPEAANPELVLVPFNLLRELTFLGLFWTLANLLQTEPNEPKLPSFWTSLGYYIKCGVKLFPYVLLVNVLFAALLQLPILPPPETIFSAENIPYTLLTVALISLLIGPILAAPVIQSAQLRAFRAIFNIPKTVALLREHYVTGLQAMALGILVFVVYGGIIQLLMITPWGGLMIPFALVPMLVTMWHLLCQGLPMELTSWKSSGGLNPA